MKFILVLFTLFIASSGSSYIRNRVQRDWPAYRHPVNVDPNARETIRCHLRVKYCMDLINKSNPDWETPCNNAERIRQKLESVIERCALLLPPVTLGNLRATKDTYEECLNNAN